jgi:hypothetical protein
VSGTGSHYLKREESYMYDRETRFVMEETLNHARIEYTEKGVMHMASRRCMILGISPSTAVLGIVTQFTIPKQFCLDIPEARIDRIGCVLKRVNANNTIEARFLRLLSQRELDRIFVYSDHPAHQGRLLDLRA